MLTAKRFAYTVLAAQQVVAFANAINFGYDDRAMGGSTVLHWSTGENVDSAVWVTLCLVVVTAINLFPVKVSIEAPWALVNTFTVSTAVDTGSC